MSGQKAKTPRARPGDLQMGQQKPKGQCHGVSYRVSKKMPFSPRDLQIMSGSKRSGLPRMEATGGSPPNPTRSLRRTDAI